MRIHMRDRPATLALALRRIRRILRYNLLPLSAHGECVVKLAEHRWREYHIPQDPDVDIQLETERRIEDGMSPLDVSLD